jgi:hypothetical protein
MGLKYPGPGKTAAQYKNYLTLIEGELGLNPVMESLLHGAIQHPIASDTRLTARLARYYHDQLHQRDWAFEVARTGYTIVEVQRNDPDLARDMRLAMDSHRGRRPGESYAQLNKTLYMAIHRTTEAVVRDCDLLSSVEDGAYAHTWDGLGLYKAITTLSLGEHGEDKAALRKEKLLTLRDTPYVPGPKGIREMFRKISKARTELAGFRPPTLVDDATILIDVHGHLEKTHALFVESREVIENNVELSGKATTLDSARVVHERFEKRFLKLWKQNPSLYKAPGPVKITVRVATVKDASPRRPHKRRRDTPHRDHGQTADRFEQTPVATEPCAFHPKSVRRPHNTCDCMNPWSQKSLWADQGNTPLTTAQWRERIAQGLAPPPPPNPRHLPRHRRRTRRTRLRPTATRHGCALAPETSAP